MVYQSNGRRSFHYYSLALLAIFAVSCGSAQVPGTIGQSAEIEPVAVETAEFEAPVYFSAVPAESDVEADRPKPRRRGGLLRPYRNSFLVLRRDGLGKEFLLHASVIPQEGAATSSATQGRIVYFKQKAGKVLLMQSTRGSRVTRDLPAQLLLAEIPLVRQNEYELVLDFDTGMSNVYTKSWYSESKRQFEAAPVENSFVDSIQSKGKFVEIKHIVQLKNSNGRTANLTTTEVRYFLSRYQRNPDFDAVESSKFEWVGYFTNGPLTEERTGRQYSLIEKFDHKKPIVFHVSANTPKTQMQAIKEGIEYWNGAFGKKIVEAKVAPEGVTAPDPQYNIFQWVPFENAGYAYADALVDPRSGEIRHAQIYLTSVFEVASRRRALEYLRARQQKQDSKEEVGISFLPSARLCNHEGEKQFAKAIEKLVADRASDETILKVSQDYVRHVSAHEVGHTLGLRHNFAGNWASEVGVRKISARYGSYVMNNKLTDEVLTSSVMDYLPFKDDVIAGAQIKTRKEAFSYDKLAILWGYEDRPVDRKNDPLFCTDDHTGIFADCNRFDSGNEVLEFYTKDLDIYLIELPTQLVDQFIRAKSDPNRGIDYAVDRLNLSASTAANKVVNATMKQLEYLSDKTRSLTIERKFGFVSDINRDGIRKMRLKWIEDQFDAMGGINEAFNYLPNSNRSHRTVRRDAMRSVRSYLEREDVRKGKDHLGRKYELTDDEVQYIENVTDAYFKKLDELVVEKLLEELVKLDDDKKVFSEDLQDSTLTELESQLRDTALKVVLLAIGIAEDGRITYAYDYDLRKSAAKALSKSLGPWSDWSYEGRAKVKAALKRQVNAVLEKQGLEKKIKDLKEEDYLEMERALRRWVMEQKELIGLL